MANGQTIDPDLAQRRNQARLFRPFDVDDLEPQEDDPLARLRAAREEFDQRQEAERGADDPLEALKDARARFDAQQPVPGREAPPDERGFIQRFRQEGPRALIPDFAQDFVRSRIRARDRDEEETGERPGQFRVPESQ